MNAVLTFVLIGGLWIGIARLLAVSLRGTRHEPMPTEQLDRKTAPWREPPSNRRVDAFPGYRS